VKDLNKLIEWYLREKSYETVRKLLKMTPADTIYQYTPLLMSLSPEQTVEMLMSLPPDVVETEKLIPALLRCEYQKYPKGEDPVVKYLEWAIKRSKTSQPVSIHNLLLARYAYQETEEELEEYVRKPESAFGLDFGLQLCLKKNRRRAAVIIYARMEMYEQSVEMALEYGKETGDWDMKLANEIATRAPDPDERKNLIKQIVDFLVAGKKINKAMETVQKCQDLLSIEDIIKDLPDDMNISEISDELCSSLEQSNRKVATIRENMNLTKETTERIKKENKELDEKKYILPEDTSCTLSKLPLKGRTFFHFIDGTSFIDQPLMEFIKHYPLPEEIADQIKEKEDILNDETKHDQHTVMKQQITDLVVSEHPYYSQYLIKSVSQPFMQNVTEADVLSWKL